MSARRSSPTATTASVRCCANSRVLAQCTGARVQWHVAHEPFLARSRPLLLVVSRAPGSRREMFVRAVCSKAGLPLQLFFRRSRRGRSSPPPRHPSRGAPAYKHGAAGGNVLYDAASKVGELPDQLVDDMERAGPKAN